MSTHNLQTELLKRLYAELGSEAVIVDEAQLEVLSRTCTPQSETPFTAVYPATMEQVRAVVSAANDFNQPVWPVSTGKNWGYSEKVASYPGGITMILERMNRIHHLDEELGYAVIEPGVTYQQLDDYLRDQGSRFWADCAGSTKFASVLGNALDKGRGLTPYGDHFGCLCGMDVVLPNGEVLETGGGPRGQNKVRHLYKWGVGPFMDGLFVQSNLGIVVKAGIWLMPEPERFDFAAFEYTASESDFGRFIDDLRELVFCGALRSHPHVANDFAMMCILSQYPYNLLNGKPMLSESDLHRWRKQHGVARWTFGCGLYGSREEVRFQKRVLRRVLRRYGLVRFVGACAKENWYGHVWRWATRTGNRVLGKSSDLYNAMVPAINLFRGIPTDYFVRQAYFKTTNEKPDTDIDPARDQCGLVWIGPVVPFTGTHIQKALELARPIFRRHSFDFFVELIVESARSVIVLTGAFYARTDPEEIARARAWYEEMREIFTTNGYPPYRATTMNMPNILDHNPPARDVLRTIKSALDPSNVVAPGRYGTAPRE